MSAPVNTFLDRLNLAEGLQWAESGSSNMRLVFYKAVLKFGIASAPESATWHLSLPAMMSNSGHPFRALAIRSLKQGVIS